MASACVNLPPRISFSLDFVQLTNSPRNPHKDDNNQSFLDFEFKLNGDESLNKILPADELFSGGKLLPFQNQEKKNAQIAQVSEIDCSSVSPKAPKSVSRWREFLGLKKVQNIPKPPINLPLLDRSSSSSSSEEITKNLLKLSVSAASRRRRGRDLGSPRLNSCGKIVFQELERSSSSPGSFDGGPNRVKSRIERSYSANVRVRPVLNVPICSSFRSGKNCSVFGFGQFFSSSKKDGGGGGGGGVSRNQSTKRNGSGKYR